MMRIEPLNTGEDGAPETTREERFYQLIQADWTVVQAAAQNATWVTSCAKSQPDGRYMVFPLDRAVHADLEAGLAPHRDRIELRTEALGKTVADDPAQPVQTLDALKAAGKIIHVHYLRIDASAAAMDIIQGARKLLRHSRIDIIEIAGGPNGATGLSPLAFLLAHYDYVVMRMAGNDFQRLSTSELANSQWPGTTFALHRRLLPAIVDLSAEMLDLPGLLAQHGIAVRGVIHIGANEAAELPTYMQLGAKRVLYVEANPVLAERLSNRVGGMSGVSVAHCAVNDVDGPIALRVTSNDQASSILPLKIHQQLYPEISEAAIIEVPGMRLDRLLDSLAIDAGDFNLMSLDVQGAELRALLGATATLAAIQAIVVEINFEELYAGGAQIEEIDDFLGSHGFDRVATITPFHPSWGDALYIRHASAAERRLAS